MRGNDGKEHQLYLLLITNEYFFQVFFQTEHTSLALPTILYVCIHQYTYIHTYVGLVVITDHILYYVWFLGILNLI